MAKEEGAAGQKNFRGGQPPTEGPSNMHPLGEPGISAQSDRDIRAAKGVPNPDDHIPTGMTPNHPSFGKGGR
jgi:hypothetical protein